MSLLWFLSGVAVGAFITGVYMTKVIIPHVVKKFESEGLIKFLKEPKK